MKQNKIMLTAIALIAMAFMFTSCGPSKATLARQATQAISNIEDVEGLENKFIWLQANAQSDSNYIIDIKANEVFPSKFLYYRDKQNITITLRGIDSIRTISSKFTVAPSVTLILDSNITLKETVTVLGTLIMNEGSTITGIVNDYNAIDSLFANNNGNSTGGAVLVYGTFIMNGGVISGNTVKRRIPSSEEIQKLRTQKQSEKQGDLLGQSLGRSMAGGLVGKMGKPGRTVRDKANAEEIKSDVKVNYSASDFPASDLKGGGVYVSEYSTFTKTGGIINGYTGDKGTDNVVVDNSGNAIQGKGHAIYFAGKEPKAIDTTVGTEMNISFSNGVFKDNNAEVPQQVQQVEPEPVNTEAVVDSTASPSIDSTKVAEPVGEVPSETPSEAAP